MRIHYDWRLARVIDSEAAVVDEMAWSSKRSVGALADRLHDLQSGRMSPEARTLSERFPEAVADTIGAMSDPDWPELDEDEQKLISEASTRLAKRGVADAAGDFDRRLCLLYTSDAADE